MVCNVWLSKKTIPKEGKQTGWDIPKASKTGTKIIFKTFGLKVPIIWMTTASTFSMPI